MSLTIGNISIFMGPHGTGAPDDLAATIVGFIDGATTHLEIAVQELDCRGIAEAIIRAEGRGVKVRIVLEADYLIPATNPKQDPFTHFPPNTPSYDSTREENRLLHDALLRRRIWARTDFNPKIFHQKFIVRDRTAVLTGSTNFTNTGVTRNLNHIVIIDDPDVAGEYRKEFREISKGRFGKQSVEHSAAPKEIMVSNVRVKPLFAPDHNPEMEIMKTMAKARSRVDFVIFTFSNSSGIDDQMKIMALAGVQVEGALDARQANQSWAASHGLKNVQNIKLHKVSSSATVGKLHHKLMVVDERAVIIGSFNYTAPANTTNDENIIVLGDLDATDPAQVAAEQQIGAFARNEINRILTDHGTVLN